MVKVVYSC